MAIIKSLIGNKKGKKNTDGQEEFFREDFPPVVNKPAGKKVEEKPAPAKKATEPKKATAVKKASGSKRVTPQPVERIINPNAGKTNKVEAKADKPAAKKAAAKAEPKKVTAKAEAKKAATKPAAKAEPKKAATEPAAKAEPKKTTTNKASTKPKKAAVSEELYDDSPEVKGAVAVQESRESANGKWDIRRAKDGRFFFSLYASNHVVIAYSQIYSSLTAVTTGINSVIANAAKAETEDTTLKKSVSLPCPKWEIYFDKADQYRFRLYAPNGLCICHSSHGYATKGGCKGGIESIKRFASEEASVNKSYLK